MFSHRSLPLVWRTSGEAVIYLFVPEASRPAIAVHAGAWCSARLMAPDGSVIARGDAGSPLLQAADPGPAGVWSLALRPVGPQERVGEEVPLWVEAEHARPFVVPGPGIVPSHFPEPHPILRLGASRHAMPVWLWVPPGLARLTLQTTFSVDRVATAAGPEGVSEQLVWRLDRSAYHVAELAQPLPGWWCIPVAAGPAGRLTTWEGAPLFGNPGAWDAPGGRQPSAGLPTAHLTVGVSDGDPTAARVELFRGAERWAIYDILPGEQAEVITLPGPAELRITRGFSAVPVVRRLELRADQQRLEIALRAGLTAEPGWISGDHHVHSYCEDGGQSPEAVVRAAAAQGLDYVVVTDEPEPLLAAGLQRYNRPGRFLALPGQECMNPDVHCNALNTYVKIPCPPYGEFPETYSTPREWLADVEAQSRTHPAALMLNHPSHLPAAARLQPYFRAWAQADANPGMLLVENCDFESWFARLNAGRRLTALWTTDGHDMAWIPAGTRRSFVYVGAREWDEADIIAALRAGRVFNARHPGALLYLTVDGKMPGDEVSPQGRPARVRLACRTTRPLRALELIVNGAEYVRWAGHGSFEWEAEQDLVLPVGWALARAYVDEAPLGKDGHSLEPMTASGCVAFTNPVYLV